MSSIRDIRAQILVGSVAASLTDPVPVYQAPSPPISKTTLLVQGPAVGAPGGVRGYLQRTFSQGDVLDIQGALAQPFFVESITFSIKVARTAGWTFENDAPAATLGLAGATLAPPALPIPNPLYDLVGAYHTLDALYGGHGEASIRYLSDAAALVYTRTISRTVDPSTLTMTFGGAADLSSLRVFTIALLGRWV